MNKTAIKNFAIWARVQLIEAAKRRAYEYEIAENGENDPSVEVIGGRLLSDTEKKQRRQLIDQIRQKGYPQVMEEAAYTWFNRFIALRFMEVNGYLPSKTRVFTDETGAFKPEILKQAMNVELVGLDRNKVFDLLDRQDNEALYKYLLIAQCNALSDCLPYMFEEITNWTELLFPANLLRKGSVIDQMISEIPEEDWTDAVQIIGWLYQYYNSELKDDTFALLKKNVKITKERIPAATQLFTPDWIVRYMVENSLGRLWVEGHPQAKAQFMPVLDDRGAVAVEDGRWNYYLEEAEQEPEVEVQLEQIREEYADLSPEDIKFIDPCMGSGHILVYAFDVLMQIYTAQGYLKKDAAKLILEKNLYGIDIDKRAYQLAYFAVMMKARQYNRAIFKEHIRPNLIYTQNPGRITADSLKWFGEKRQLAQRLLDEFRDAEEYGSILKPDVTLKELDELQQGLVQMEEGSEDANLLVQNEIFECLSVFAPLIRQARMLVQKYDVVVTNPPYMNSSNINPCLNKYLKEKFEDYRTDSFSVFIVRASQFTKRFGFCGFFTPYVWMFILSYERLRNYLYNKCTIRSLVQFEYSAFEEATVPICTFTFMNEKITHYEAPFLRLTDFKGGMEVQRVKALEAIGNKDCNYRFHKSSDSFSIIPGEPVAYWQSNSFFDAFTKYPAISQLLDVKKGLTTADNNRFLRMWWEVDRNKTNISNDTITSSKWCRTHKGGDYRKWYGNTENMVKWEASGLELKAFPNSVVRNEEYYGRECISWNDISSSKTGFRFVEAGSISNASGPSIYGEKQLLLYSLGLCNSRVVENILTVLCPTIHFEVGQVAQIPISVDKGLSLDVSTISENCIRLSKTDWDAFETSWDFLIHPLLPVYKDDPDDSFLLEDLYKVWEEQCAQRFNQLKANEEELNRIFIDIYGLQDELTPEVEDKDVTVRKAELSRDIRSLISYAVGCMFGRYSLDKPGLAYAGGDFDSVFKKDVLTDGQDNRITFGGTSIALSEDYTQINCDGNWIDVTYSPDKDNIIPICDDDYFDDDIVGRFVDFIRTVYGAETLEQNLRFIADALGGKGTSREVIRNYFLNDFYTDHLKIYQKRPIYWLFSSGKKNGFKALIYMHRYQPDLLARLRTDYVHEQQERYRTQLQMLEESVQNASPSDRVKLNKRIAKLKDQALEIQQYEEKIHHLADQMISIDLDDGVKVNYAKFQDVLEKIK